MPPRHGKSELASIRFPAWFLGQYPKQQIIAASYNIDLARDFGRDVRDVVGSPEYAKIFDGIGLVKDNKSADRWRTTNGGQYVAAGVGTGVTGKGADIFLVDDPVKDREEAESETRRATVWNWYTSTAYTRLMKGSGRIIVIQTRWHEDDLSGRLLTREAEGADQWEKLILPAFDEDGKALWPEWYGEKALRRIQTNIGSRDWQALYMQNPTPDDGEFFKREWFAEGRYPKSRTPRCWYYGTSDYAVSDDGDYTVHALWGVTKDNIWLVDGWRGRTGSEEWIDRKLALIARWKPITWFGEKGTIQKSIEPALRTRMRERKIYCRLEWVPSLADKAARARGFQARAEMGMVRLPTGELGDTFLEELLKFPAGRHDDCVDCCSLLGLVIDNAHPALMARERAKDQFIDDYMAGAPARPEERARVL